MTFRSTDLILKYPSPDPKGSLLSVVFLDRYHIRYLGSFKVKSFSSSTDPRKRATGQIIEWEKGFAPYRKFPSAMNSYLGRWVANNHKKRCLKSLVTREVISGHNNQNGHTLLMIHQLVCYFWETLPYTKGQGMYTHSLSYTQWEMCWVH